MANVVFLFSAMASVSPSENDVVLVNLAQSDQDAELAIMELLVEVSD